MARRSSASAPPRKRRRRRGTRRPTPAPSRARSAPPWHRTAEETPSAIGGGACRRARTRSGSCRCGGTRCLGVWSGGEWVALQHAAACGQTPHVENSPEWRLGPGGAKARDVSETTRVVVLTAHNPMGRSRDAAANDAATQTLVRDVRALLSEGVFQDARPCVSVDAVGGAGAWAEPGLAVTLAAARASRRVHRRGAAGSEPWPGGRVRAHRDGAGEVDARGAARVPRPGRLGGGGRAPGRRGAAQVHADGTGGGGMQLGRRNRVSRVAMSASKESREEATRRAPVDRSRLFARPKSRVEEVPRCLILLSCYIARFSRPGSPYSRSHSLRRRAP